MAPKASPARLIIADSERDPDMLYATRFFAPDAFLFLEQNGHRIAVLNDLEVDRGRAQAQVDEVLSMSDELKRLGLKEGAPLAEFVPAFLRSRKIRRADVPASFPLASRMSSQRQASSWCPQRDSSGKNASTRMTPS